MATKTTEPIESVKRAQKTKQFIVKYRQQFYDISEFLHKHPGGINTLKGLNNTDMTQRFLKAPPHSDAAMYLMNEYKIDANKLSTAPVNAGGMHAHNALGNLLENGIEMLQDQAAEDKNNNQLLDESMEHLVDWSKPMLRQIESIKEHYDEWVHKPVDRPLRLFGPWYLEMCTKTPWWIVPIFWLPIIISCAWHDYKTTWENKKLFSFLILYFFCGILLWTLLEYALHRFVFHMKVDGNSGPMLCTLHFMIHGLHHKVPFDNMRLVFPPLPGVILATTIYTPLSFFFPYPRVLLQGALFGYLCYDMVHYYLHYGNPTRASLYHLKRYHYQHHFAHQDLGYGISSPLWDIIFKTRINLRKLRFQLRWS